MPDGSLALSETRLLRPERPSTTDGTQHVSDLPRFGRFRVDAELGAGGMGTVYRAHDELLGRPVAIKTLQAHSEPELRERFVREARAIGAVLHPNILAIYSAGTEAETPYLVMELAPSGSLRDRIKHGPLPVDAVRALGIQIGRALAAAHAAGILHRDVKPANILCTQEGVWKLADFGIARLPDSTLTVTGQFLGSPSYAAPESLRAGEFSPASDVYGLGATLYEALTGAPPYGDHDLQSLVRKLEQEPPALRERIAVPAALGDAIMATLARDPSRRPSAEQLALWLASSHAAEVSAPAVAAAPEVATPGAAAPPRRKKLVIAGLAAAALLAIVLVTSARRDGSASATPLGASAIGGAPTAVAPEPAGAASGEPAVDPSGASGAAGDGDPGQDPTQPTVVDEYGNPVDEETARRVLEQLEQDPRIEREPRGRGRGRRKHRGD